MLNHNNENNIINIKIAIYKKLKKQSYKKLEFI